MKVKVGDKEYEISEATDIGIDEVVKDRAKYTEMRKAELWVPYVLEVIDRRLAYLNGRIVDYFLKHRKRKK